ncbi:MAG: glycosyltransferase family 4 protein [Terriglobales bacterium]
MSAAVALPRQPHALRQRVVYLAASGQVGGAERCLLSLLAGLDRERFDPAVVVGSPGPLLEMLEGQGMAAQMLPMPMPLRRLSRSAAGSPRAGARATVSPLWQAPAYALRLQRELTRMQPEVIHSNGMKMHYFSAMLPTPGAALIWHLHDFPPGPDQGRESWPSRLLRRLASRPALAVANSEAVAAAYAARYPELRPKLRVIWNGVAPAAMRGGDGAAFRARHGIGSGALVFGMLAIFAPWKGQEVFLRAARQVLDQAPEVIARRLCFVLAGGDIYDTHGHGARRAELEQLSRQLALEAAVRFTGYTTDIAGAFAALDVAVHASTRPEPFGRTLIEAMAAGVPVIAARCGGVPEIVDHGIHGVLTAPGDPEALAQAMLALAHNPAQRSRLALAGRDRVERQFNQQAVGRQFESAYREAAAQWQH